MDDRFNFTFNDEEGGSINPHIEQNDGSQGFMSGNLNGAQPAGYYSSPVRMQKSYKPLIIALACLFGAVAVGAALWFLLMNMGGSYERAERNSLSALADMLDPLWNPGNTSEELTMTIIPDGMEPVTLNMEAIIREDGDFFLNLGGGMGDMSLSLLLWQLGDKLTLQLPGLTDYTLTLDAAEIYGGMDLGGFDQKELEKILGRVLDKYFELTKDAMRDDNVEVSAGGLSVTADKYTIRFNEYLINELLKETLRAFMASDSFMKMVDDMLNAQYDSMEEMYREWGMPSAVERQSAREMLQELLDAAERESVTAGRIFATMEVFVSRNQVVGRKIIIPELFTTINFVNIESGSDYVALIEADSTDYWGGKTVISYLDKGKKDGNYMDGSVALTFSDGALMNMTAEITYKDVRVYDNGLFSGDFTLTVPNLLSAEMVSVVDGKTQHATGSVSIPGQQILTFDINLKTDTGKAITAPDVSGGRVLDINDTEDRYEFNNILLEIMDGLGLGSRLFGMGAGSWDDWDDWD
jgi:hypothetical protein